MSYTIYKPQTHLDWLKARQEGIGSSEATILMGVNHYKGGTRYNLYRKKKGMEEIPTTEDETPWLTNERFWLGHMEEPTVAACFAAKTGAYIIPESEGDWIAIDNDKPWRRVSPDRLYIPKGMANTRENWCICECKTSDISINPDCIPAYWYCQLQYQMGVMGVRHGAISWKSTFPTSHHDYAEFDFNQAYFDLLCQQIDSFWINNVLKDVCPAPETIDDVRDMFDRKKPNITGKVLEADSDIITMHNRLVEIKNICADLENEEKIICEELEKIMKTGEYEAIRNGDTDISVITPPAKKKVLNLEQLKKDVPEIYSIYAESVTAFNFDKDRFKTEQKDLYKKYNVTPPAGEAKFKIIYPKKTSTRSHDGIFGKAES